MSNLIKGSLEKIYTPKALTNHLLDLLSEYYNDDITEFLEPAAGSGAMIDVIKSRYHQPILAVDIFNETYRKDITQHNFLSLPMTYKKGRVCIMNPPFSKGLKFMYKALESCDMVISILSYSSFTSFKYDDYNCKLIELISKQKFSDGKSYEICIMVVTNKDNT